MAGSKKTAAGAPGSGGGATVEPLRKFGVTSEQLVELMSLRTKEERSQALAEYEGVEGLMGHLEVNRKTGLPADSHELVRRRAAFGTNVIPSTPPKAFIALCIDAIQDKTLIILMCAAVLSIILGVTVEDNKSIAWIDGAAILSAVVIVVLVTAANDWTKERQFRGLQRKLESDSKFSVVRGGDTIEVTHADLVVGDIAEFKYGNTFPVDGILVQGNDVKVSEAALTGEAELVRKNETSSPMLFSGTQVMEGRGTMLVTAVGPNSQQGRIFALMRGIEEESGFITEALKKLRGKMFKSAEEPVDPEPGAGRPGVEGQVKADEAEEEAAVQAEVFEYQPSDPPGKETGIIGRVKQYREKRRQQKEEAEEDKEGVSSESVLQKKLNKLAVQIGYGGTAAAIVCILVLTVRFSIEEYGVNGRGWNSSTDFSQILHFVIIGITVLVVAIPEGLPLAVTIALAFSVKKMLKDNNLVRHLHACETMGNATSICSDKTGTLTTNRMTVVESYFAGIHYDVTPKAEDLPGNLLEMLKDCIAINSNYTSLLLEPGKESSGATETDLSLKERVLRLLPWRKAGSNQLLGQGLKLQVGNVTECALLGLLEELSQF
jgi:magnesium-transporting ATPase (P-type)